MAAWFATPVGQAHERDEFYLKLMLSLTIAHPAVSGVGLADPRKVIYTQRAGLYRELHAVTARRSGADPRRELALILLLDQVVMHLEADLRWLDIVEQRLDEIRRQPPPAPEVKLRGRPKKA